jgi:ELWxxDGT repeat protein
MPGDNQLSGAVNVGFGANRNGKVGRRDLDDLYRVNLSRSGSLDVNLSAIVPKKASKQVTKKTRVGVELYKLKRSFDEVASSIGGTDFNQLSASEISDNFELVRSSRARSARRASIALSSLDAGDYVIRIRQNKLEGKYRLSVGGSLLPEEPIVIPVPDPPIDPGTPPTDTPAPAGGGNSLATARVIDFPFTAQGGFVNTDDTQDYYQFTVPTGSSGDYKFDLFGLSADANVEILDVEGKVLKAAANIGNQSESILLPLDEGRSYYARVSQGSGATSYGLSMALLTDNALGTFAGGASSASLLTPTTTLGVVASNYVLDGAKNSTEDLYKFVIPTNSRSFLNLELRGVGGASLAGNLDVELFGEDGFTPALNPEILTSSRAGNSAEVFGGTLFAGTYYVRIKPGPGATVGGIVGTGEGSEYSLSMSLNPKNTVPTITRDINYGQTLRFDENDQLIDTINNSSNAQFLTNVGSLAYFSASDGTDIALWRTDGSLKGTQKLKAFPSADSLRNFTAANGYLYFVGNDGVNGAELWRSDGTTAGTRMVQDLRLGSEGSNASSLVAAGNRLYFIANDTNNTNVTKFFRTDVDGTAIEAVPGFGTIFRDVLENVEDGPKTITFQNNTLFFSAVSLSNLNNQELWTISNAGNAVTGTATQRDLTPSLSPGGGALPNDFILADNDTKLYASAILVDDGPRALVGVTVTTDGNGNSTFGPATQIGGSLTDPTNFVVAGSTVYFSGRTTAIGTELWRLNPTTNTVTSLDIRAGAADSNPTDLVAVGSSVYFFADDGTGRGLWRDTGTGAPTRVAIRDSVSTELGSLYQGSELTEVDGVLYFSGDSATKGRELWSYNPTNDTMKLNDIRVGAASSNPGRLTDIGGILYFIADNGNDGIELMSL